MIDPATRDALKRRIWAQQDRVSRKAIMRKEGITSAELDELYDEAIREFRATASKHGMVGRHYGAWEVLAEDYAYIAADGREAHVYRCRCKCGTEWSIAGGDLIKRRVNDCGCGSYERARKRALPIDWSKKVEVRHYV